ncbi:hypothetical protein [Novosphingobium sp. KACC 22771]|uniref:hypothetical protein n=1 Tax=Novosphingobium sp. KACC 22771 TaxID=3025670 RepID=UPI002366ED65|nr:hypothetical protein [Novosphingobium sp. KACC 22771]WDF73514.1 hypothetical protein PQ467_05565 [Novosphingobium sp. KACC 22771]
MTRKPASIAPEATAAIDRAIATLQVLKTHLKAKKLRGQALSHLLRVALDELREFEGPFDDMFHQDLGVDLARYGGSSDSGEKP